MAYKKRCVLMALVGLWAGPLFAGGDHHHEHGSESSKVGLTVADSEATATIHVNMMDSMRYEFSPEPNFKSGDVVTFVITNKGKMLHEFSIGDEKEQISHRKMMQKMPDMVHEDGNTVSLQPGESKSLTWKFTGDSEVVFACNVPGHFEAGMVHRVTLNHK
ncbi:MAG: hypothetical protein COA99_17070 [Moraxellaceae bacterium]|nr:MAG: hypothetical protein COA99_17070 [Moraxellaceae bacterium]